MTWGGLVCPSPPYTGSSPKDGGEGSSVLYLRPAEKWEEGFPSLQIIFVSNSTESKFLVPLLS